MKYARDTGDSEDPGTGKVNNRCVVGGPFGGRDTTTVRDGKVQEFTELRS